MLKPYNRFMTQRESNFETLALPLMDGLFRTSLRMVHDQTTAERCVELTYVEASRSFDGMPPSSKTMATLRVRLFTILFRTIRNHGGYWRQIRNWLSLPGRPRNVPADSPCQPEHDQILRTLDNVPTPLREVLLLSDVENFSRTEVQTILGLSPEVIAARLAEGRARLLAELRDNAPSNPEMLEGTATA